MQAVAETSCRRYDIRHRKLSRVDRYQYLYVDAIGQLKISHLQHELMTVKHMKGELQRKLHQEVKEAAHAKRKQALELVQWQCRDAKKTIEINKLTQMYKKQVTVLKRKNEDMMAKVQKKPSTYPLDLSIDISYPHNK
jgi:hypothetical protein